MIGIEDFYTDSVTIQKATKTFSSEGIAVNTWATLKTIAGHFQILKPTANASMAFGVSPLPSGTGLIFYVPDTTILELMRAVIGSKTYEIKNIRSWPDSHSQALLVPVVV
jgi:hypothetical protein